jgi:hypothetical protein
MITDINFHRYRAPTHFKRGLIGGVIGFYPPFTLKQLQPTPDEEMAVSSQRPSSLKRLLDDEVPVGMSGSGLNVSYQRKEEEQKRLLSQLPNMLGGSNKRQKGNSSIERQVNIGLPSVIHTIH